MANYIWTINPTSFCYFMCTTKKYKIAKNEQKRANDGITTYFGKKVPPQKTNNKDTNSITD